MFIDSCAIEDKYFVWRLAQTLREGGLSDFGVNRLTDLDFAALFGLFFCVALGLSTLSHLVFHPDGVPIVRGALASMIGGAVGAVVYCLWQDEPLPRGLPSMIAVYIFCAIVVLGVGNLVRRSKRVEAPKEEDSLPETLRNRIDDIVARDWRRGGYN